MTKNIQQDFEFFIIVPPGLEDLSLMELEIKLKMWRFTTEAEGCLFDQLKSVTKVKGGLEVVGSLEAGLWTNHLLRIPTRVLLRLEKFKCRDFPRLYKKVQGFNWTPWLLGKIPEIHATAKKSRLIHSDRIAETVKEALVHHAKGFPPKKTLQALGDSKVPVPELYVDLYEDNCKISLDLSGEALYFRNLSEDRRILEAPLRENLALALLLESMDIYGQNHPDLKENPPSLLDPMGGSGVFIKEALQFFDLNRSEENGPFAYQFFTKVLPPIQLCDEKARSDFFKTFFYRDLDPKALEAARFNLKGHKNISLETDDLFTAPKKTESFSPLLCITNPPYGLRLKIKGEGENQSGDMASLLKAITAKYTCAQIGILAPKEWVLGKQLDRTQLACKKLKLKILQKRFFQNGGLDVVFITFGQE